MGSPHKTIFILVIGAFFMLLPPACSLYRLKQSTKELREATRGLKSSVAELAEITEEFERSLAQLEQQANEFDRLVGELESVSKEKQP